MTEAPAPAMDDEALDALARLYAEQALEQLLREAAADSSTEASEAA